jgi:hypothetical protein
MRLLGRGALAVTLSLLSVQLASATCSSRRCPATEADRVAALRTRVATDCNCSGVARHRDYVRCARQAIKAAVRAGELAGRCKATVQRCEALTTCGHPEGIACCRVTSRGKMKATIAKSAAVCGGTACAGVRSAMDACTDEGKCSGSAAVFRSLQGVFTGSCALPSCHSSIARQGGLVLESEDVSYSSLVDQPSTHPEAQAAGLLRVKSGDPENSFLIRKLRGLGPGLAMPDGGAPLPESIIAVFEDWIARGAHTTVEECPALAEEISPAHAGEYETVCDLELPEPGDYVWKPQEPLPVPAASEGVQMYVPGPERTIEPGKEWEICYTVRLDWDRIAADMGYAPGQRPTIKRQEYRMHEGSHHLLLYAYFGQHPEVWPEGFWPCIAANCLRPGDCPEDAGQFTLPIGGTQVAGTRYVVQYPEGVGLPVLGPAPVLIANLHYTNPFLPKQDIYGEAWLNLYFHRPGEFKVLLDGIFAVNYGDLLVEPWESRTISRIWRPRSILTRQSANAAVFQLFGHMHKRGTLFQIDYVRDGACSGNQALCGRDSDCRPGETCILGPGAEDTRIYHTTEWDNAPVVDFQPPYLQVDADEGLRWTCTHVNGDPNDPNLYPPKRCHAGCNSCGWDAATSTCKFTRFEPVLGQAGDPLPAGRDGVMCLRTEEIIDCTADPAVCARPEDCRQTYRLYLENEPIPLVFGELADDDMCNMFGYFIKQEDLAKLD